MVAFSESIGNLVASNYVAVKPEDAGRRVEKLSARASRDNGALIGHHPG